MSDHIHRRHSSTASLSDFVQSIANFSHNDSFLVSSPFVLSSITEKSSVTRMASQNSALNPYHMRNRSSLSLPGSVDTKRFSSLLPENRSAQNSPRNLPSQTLPPKTALPPIPPFRSSQDISHGINDFPVSPEMESNMELDYTSVTPTGRAPLCRRNESKLSSSIPTLSTMQAIRALAQSAPSLIECLDVEDEGEEEQQSSEIQALRAALSYTLSRSDRLQMTLAREQAEKRLALNELTVLRANVLSILGKSVFHPPQENASPRAATNSVEENQAAVELPTQDDSKTQSTKVLRGQWSSPPIRVLPQVVDSDAEKALPKTPLRPPSSGGIPISSLRKANAARGLGIEMPVSISAQVQEEEDSEDDSIFEISPVQPVRQADVSISDFLNASRMSKREIQEHDARLLSSGTLGDVENWRNRSRSSSSVRLDPADGNAVGESTGTPRMSKFLRGISKKMETERQRIMQTSSGRRPSAVSLSASHSNVSLLGNSSFSLLRRKTSISSSTAPSTVTINSYSTASANKFDPNRSSLGSAFSEGPAASKVRARSPIFMETSIIPALHTSTRSAQTGLAPS